MAQIEDLRGSKALSKDSFQMLDIDPRKQDVRLAL